MIIRPWSQLLSRLTEKRSNRLAKNKSRRLPLQEIDALEPRIMLTADMHSFFGHVEETPTQQYIPSDAVETGTFEDSSGYLYSVDPLMVLAGEQPVAAPGDETYWDDVHNGVILEETFELHSNPGALHTIYLDFDGHTTSDTLWNSFSGLDSIESPAFDYDGEDAFSDPELVSIQNIWARVAEDFAPFNVDVTTEEPEDLEDLKNFTAPEDPTDTRWGIRVIIGDDAMGTGAGGIAYLDSFTWNTDTPVFAFNGQAPGGENNAAMTISHEVGHALGLRHDGFNAEEYYGGHGTGETSWGPIMGAPFGKNVTQWSKGEYANSTNSEDDLTIITTGNGFGYNADDYGDNFASATPLNTAANPAITDGNGNPALYGLIGTTDDRDMFSFWAEGEIDIEIDVVQYSPNLDLLAVIYNQDFEPIGFYNDPDLESPTLGVHILDDLSSGQYYLEVLGVGNGDPYGAGYSAYGSLGNYRLQGTVDEISTINTIITDVTVSEFESFATFEVSLNIPSAVDTEVTLSTQDITAKAGTDYVATTETIFIPKGSTTGTTTFQVPIMNDLVSEPTETFRVVVSQVVSGVVDDSSQAGVGTILDNEDPLQLYLDLDKASVSETQVNYAAEATITRNGDLSQPLVVTIVNSDDTELYLPKTVTIPANEATATFPVKTVNDGKIDGDQAGVLITVSAASFLSGENNLTVRDDDSLFNRTLGGHLFEPIDRAGYIVLDDIIVDPGRTLTIAPESQLRFTAGTGIYIDGTVLALGEYNSNIVFKGTSAERGHWAGISIRAEEEPRTIFDYVDVTDAVNGFSVFDANNPQLTVSRARIYNNDQNGVDITTRTGDIIDPEDVQIIDSAIYNNGENGIAVNSFNTEAALSRNAPLIEGNDIHHHSEGAAISLSANSSQFGVPSAETQSVVAPRIFANTLRENYRGIHGTSAQENEDQNLTDLSPIVQNNLIKENETDAIDLSVLSEYGVLNANIINNTIVENGAAGIKHSNETGNSFAIRNNILVENEYGIIAAPNFIPQIESVTRNLIWNNTTDWANYPAAFGALTSFNINRTPSDAEKNISGDPNFSSSGDYQLRPNSIAVNAGTRFEDDLNFGGYEGVEAPKTDFFGDQRDPFRDIGFDEAGPVAFPFLEDFNDQAAQQFTPVNEEQWNIQQAPSGDFYYESDTLNFEGLGISTVGLFDLPEKFEMSVEVTAVGGSQRWHNGLIIFDYKSDTDFKYAGMFAGHNQWVIGHYQFESDWNHEFPITDWDNSSRRIDSNKTYTLHLAIDNNEVIFKVDGELVGQATFSSVPTLNAGAIGLANYNAHTLFDNFRADDVVYEGNTFAPINEDFSGDDANTPQEPAIFTPLNDENWTPLNINGDIVYQADATNNVDNKLALALLEVEGTVPHHFEIAAEITSVERGTTWRDGFLIFDYKSPTDFKYAGMFTGQNAWVIGHFLGGWHNRPAEIDWDDTGRNINTGQIYDVKVAIDLNEATLIVDGETITSHLFGNGFENTLNKGRIGIAANNAQTRFHNFRATPVVPSPPPAPSASDMVFAAGFNPFFDDDNEDDELTFAAGSNKVIK